jgi:hypothetical protein
VNKTEATVVMMGAVVASLEGMPAEQKDMVCQGLALPVGICVDALVAAGVLQPD